MAAAKQLLNFPILVSTGRDFKQSDVESVLIESLMTGGYSDVREVFERLLIFDLRESVWHDIGTLLWFVTLLNKLKQQGNQLQIKLPERKDPHGDRVWSFLVRWRFFDALADCVESPINLLPSHQIPYLKDPGRYQVGVGVDDKGEKTIFHSTKLLEMKVFKSLQASQSASTQSEASVEALLREFLDTNYDKVLVSALATGCGWDFEVAKIFTEEVIGEGLRNSVLHGRSSFSIVSMEFDRANLKLAIADNGVGIPETLRSAYTQAGDREKAKKSDAELIRFFTEPEFVIDSHWIMLSVQKGITSVEGRKGLGLHYLKTNTLERGGELRIRSGTACVDFTAKGTHPVDRNLIQSPGTMIRIVAPLKGARH